MAKPRLTLVVAAAENGVIGRDGDLPWRLPADLARFKRLTMGHPLIMGRKTYESIGRPLPGRLSIALTRQPDWHAGNESVLTAREVEEAIALAGGAPGVSTEEAFVIGGGEIYRLTLPLADRVQLTRVHASIDGDTTFPDLAPAQWRLVESDEHPADSRNEHACTFEVWDRIRD